MRNTHLHTTDINEVGNQTKAIRTSHEDDTHQKISVSETNNKPVQAIGIRSALMNDNFTHTAVGKHKNAMDTNLQGTKGNSSPRQTCKEQDKPNQTKPKHNTTKQNKNQDHEPGSKAW